MKKSSIIVVVLLAAVVGLAVLRFAPGMSELIWQISNGGAWLLPLVLMAAVLDSVHPCSFSILLLTIAFLFGAQFSRRRVLLVGGLYVAGIFAAYLLIGLGVLQVLHLFNTLHFMGKLGAGLLIAFGLLNLINWGWPDFPLKLKIPAVSHTAMGRLMHKATLPAAFGLGVLVGICQFPCMGGPYLMVIGLLHDQVTYLKGFGYLWLYNLVLVVPLLLVLWVAANKVVLEKVQTWKKTNLKQLRLWAGLVMIILGVAILFL